MMYRRMTAIMTAVLLGSTALLLSACGGQEAAQRPEDEEVETPYAGPEEEAQAQQSAAHGEEGLSCLPLAAATGFAVTGVVEWVFHLCNPMSLLFLLCLAPLLERDGAV